MALKQTDALTLLKHDHGEVKQMFAKFQKARSRKEELAQDICSELTIHAQIEEHIFYPEVKTIAELEDSVLESLEEHRQMKEMIARLKGMSASDERFEPDMKVLQEDTEHHVKDEETEMFPKVKQGMDKGRLADLGQRLEQMKAQLKGQMSQRRITEDVRQVTPIGR